MIQEPKKIENCFADAQTYEYRLPESAEAFVERLGEDWAVRRNLKLRRPVFLAERDGVRMKGMLSGDTVRAGFPDKEWEEAKARFEAFLEELYVETVR